jgi:hypothetical protein
MGTGGSQLSAHSFQLSGCHFNLGLAGGAARASESILNTEKLNAEG